MAATLYFVRHGKTLFNERGIIQGWVDSPLTAEGEAQADRVGRYVRHEGIVFDHAYASTLARTHQTLERITDMPFTRDPDLREWGFGEWEAEPVRLMPKWPWGSFFEQFGGETQEGFRARIYGAISAIMARPGHESVLVVSHGSASREFISAVQAEAGSELKDVPGNCSVVRYRYDAGHFTLEEILEQEDLKRILGGVTQAL